MFNAQSLLWKKGPFSNIWVAAHCHKRLKKDQIKQTDISSSVDKILNQKVPGITYRILAFLLLGVVRIFSKKVEFLFCDCHNVLDKLKGFAGGKKANESIRAMCRSYGSITLPERFELDAFDLDILEDQQVSRENVRTCKEIVLADATRKGIKRLNDNLSDASREGIKWLNDKYYHEEDTTCYEAYSSAQTPVRDVYSPCFMNIGLNMSNLKSSMEELSGIGFSFNDRLEPMIFDDAEIESGSAMLVDEGHQTDGEQIKHPDTEINRGVPAGSDIPCDEGQQTDGEQIKHFDAEINCEESVEQIRSLDEKKSMKKVCGIRLSSEDRLEPNNFTEAEKNFSPSMLSNHGFQTDGEQTKQPGSGVDFEKPEVVVILFDNEQNMAAQEMRLPGMTSSGKQIQEKQSLSVRVAVNLESKFSGVVSPECIAVHTPATKECPRVQKKRRCLFDEATVLPNKFFKQMIDDSRDLVCKRRKAPHTAYHVWKAHKLSNLSQIFYEPLIPCHAVDFRSLVCKKIPMTPVPVETAKIPVGQVIVEPSVTCNSQEQIPIAPPTPVAHSTLLRLNEVRGVVRPNILEPASSLDSIDKESTQSEGQELDVILRDEEINSQLRDSPEKYECSLRTRRVATHLYKTFLKQRKQKGDDGTMKLSKVLNRKTKTESARLFYELLVLKTGDYIDVRQEDAYADIQVLETPKLKDVVDAGGSATED